MRAPGACVLAALACSSALGVAAAAAQSMLPRLFPRPAELVLGPPEQTTDLHPCRFGIERAGAWAAALLDTDMWAVPPDTAFDLYRPLILRGAGCDRLGSGGSGAFVQLSVALNASIPAAAAADERERERYAIDVVGADAILTVGSYAGLLRGLEKFSQLVMGASPRAATDLRIPASVRIRDAPSFQHRGIMLDTARNFIPIDTLKNVIDGLCFSSMNFLHLHLTDSSSFPFNLTRRYGPAISEHGAYSPAQTYSPADMIALQAYGLARGVTIVPEIDTPGHARPFGLPPNLAEITACTDAYWGTSGCCVEPPCGQLNPVSDLMYSILGDVLMDVAEAFPWSPYFHLGFDEVNEKCWTSDPHIADYMRKNDLTFQDILETFFDRERALLHDAYNNSKILSKKNASAAAMYWDEVVTSGLHTRLEPGDVVQFWHSTTSLLQQYLRETPPTNTAIISTYTDYYLDCGSGNEFGQPTWCDPYKTWRSIFFSDPLQGVPVDEQHRILGGEAALWTETAGPGSVGAKLFPRATAYGARLWNYNSTTSTDEWVDVEIDLGNKAISMTERGVLCDLIVPEFCLHEGNRQLCFNE